MQYNEIYTLVKPIYQWLQEHYPHDKYLKIETSGFSLCEERTMGINEEKFDKVKQAINEKIQKIERGDCNASTEE